MHAMYLLCYYSMSGLQYVIIQDGQNECLRTKHLEACLITQRIPHSVQFVHVYEDQKAQKRHLGTEHCTLYIEHCILSTV